MEPANSFHAYTSLSANCYFLQVLKLLGYQEVLMFKKKIKTER